MLRTFGTLQDTMPIAQNLLGIKDVIAERVTLVAVSKTRTDAEIMEAYNVGQRIFGENKVQEMARKHEALPKDIGWHMIGHLQSNKVRQMAAFVTLIHSVDSINLLDEINRQGQKNGRIIDCLLQVHIASEETKFGMDETELSELLSSDAFKSMANIKVKGLMGMATFTEDQSQIEREFRSLKSIFEKIKSSGNTENLEMEILSMGMSEDYTIAMANGSNMIRIGSSIFGSR